MFLAFFLGEAKTDVSVTRPLKISSLCCRTCVPRVLEAQTKGSFMISGLFS